MGMRSIHRLETRDLDGRSAKKPLGASSGSDSLGRDLVRFVCVGVAKQGKNSSADIHGLEKVVAYLSSTAQSVQ